MYPYRKEDEVETQPNPSSDEHPKKYRIFLFVYGVYKIGFPSDDVWYNPSEENDTPHPIKVENDGYID